MVAYERSVVVDSNSASWWARTGMGLEQGPGIVWRLTEPDIRLDLAFGAGDDPYDGMDRFGRIVDNRWRKYSAPAADVDRIQHGYSRASNRTYRENAVSKAQASPVYLDELYGYDGLYQLKDLDRGQLNAGKTAISAGTLNYAQEWGFDATGNWRGYREDTDGNGAWNLDQSRSHNKANEITGITGGSWVTPVHDRAGNMTTIPQGGDPTQSYSVTWDAWNRAVKYQSGITTVLENAFDGLGRRIKKIASGTTRHLYYSDRWQVLEERLGSASSADRQFIWGIRYIDELVLRDRDSDGNSGTGNLGISGSGLDERLYALQDANWNVTALADTSASIVERFTYDAYGKPTFRDGAFGVRGSSSYGWETLLGGYRYDVEWQGYYVRHRAFLPQIGYWLRRDPLGLFTPAVTYRYVFNRPTLLIDPSGLAPTEQITVVVTVRPESTEDRDAEPPEYPGPLDYDEDALKDAGWDIPELEEHWLIHNDDLWANLCDHFATRLQGASRLMINGADDANEKLKNECDETDACIKLLVLVGHAGSPQGMAKRLTSKNRPGVNETPFDVNNYLGFSGTKLYGFGMFKGVPFCKPCTIEIIACGALLGEKYVRTLAWYIEKHTGCKLRAWAEEDVVGLGPGTPHLPWPKGKDELRDKRPPVIPPLEPGE